MKTISVAIPTYEMHGKGPGFLRHSFEVLAGQTFQDFEVVVSDNSTTPVIKEVCDEYSAKLDIRYFKNPDPAHGMSSNANNAIRNATGAIIKILFLDDFLRSEHSLADLAANFDLEKDSWLVTGCEHTNDGVTFFKPSVPSYNKDLYIGENTIGSPSVLAIRNKSPLLFDTHLKWLMDCDYYKRCFDAFGEPKILSESGVVIRTGEHQVTATEITPEIDAAEKAYVKNKFSAKARNTIQLPRVTLVAVSSIRIKETIRALETSLKGITYYDAILISHERPADLPVSIRFVPGSKIESIDAYSKFMLYDLASYIESDFALVVQYDGYVVRSNKWDPAFLEYDYIGAPWKAGIHSTSLGVPVRVGNGGFSLRSKKLLNAPKELGLPFTDNGTGFFSEDGVLCVYHRAALEAYGVRYATVAVASKFSREASCPDSEARPFGFHKNLGSLPFLMRMRKYAAKLFV